MRYGFDLSDTRLFTVPVEGGLAEPLPMPVSGAGDLSPDGRFAVYSPLARDFRTWKRYEGGNAPNIWTYDFAANRSDQITNWKGSEEWPMWYGDTIYYCSDRDGVRAVVHPQADDVLIEADGAIEVRDGE